MQGGIQVNSEGRRFCDESRGYSEAAAEVLRQPGGIAWDVFDARIASVARQFEDFRAAERAGAILSAETITDLAGAMHVPPPSFMAEWAEIEKLKAGGDRDRFGRQFSAEQRCAPPFHAVKVTGALFHTQGGLAIDAVGRVKRKDGTRISQPFCGGWRGGRRVRRDGGGLSVGKRSVDRDGAWPLGRTSCGCAIAALAAHRVGGNELLR